MLRATTTLALFAILFSLTLGSGAHAQSVFMIQLGSFPSEEQAVQRWESLKSKHGNVVAPLSLRIAEVALPPENVVVYRTQAGPIETREEATQYCNKLSAASQECFVIETAMFLGAEPAMAKAAPPAPATLPEPVIAQQLSDVPAAPPAPVEVVSAPEPVIKPLVVAAPPAPAAEEEPGYSLSSFLPWRTSNNAELAATPPPVQPAPAPVQVAAVPAPEPVVTSYSEPAPQPRDLMVPPAVVIATPPVEASRATPFPSRRKPIEEVAPRVVSSGNNYEGRVQVAEAVRVPVTGMRAAPAPAMRLVTAPSRPLGLGGTPSQNFNKRTLWAQVTYFNTADAATNYWESFRNKHTQYSNGLRVRVTQPYMYARQGGRVALRVGPFASMDDINLVCAEAGALNLGCGLVKDIGTSTASSTPRDRTGTYRGYDERSRNKAWGIGAGGDGMSWVQIGSYPTPEAAWSAWESYKQSNTDLLRKAGADVTTANLSSSSRQVFRLRVGPYMNKIKALNLCGTLETRGISCIVVGGR